MGGKNTSETNPSSAIVPPSITATFVQIVLITFISWVIRTTVILVLLWISLIKFKTSAVVSGSRALVASSQSKIEGLPANARAIPTFVFDHLKVEMDKHLICLLNLLI